MSYGAQAQALDAEILRCIECRSVPDFNDLALRIFAYQLRYNHPYARYCASLGVTPANLPRSWETIPPVPAAAYKEAALCTFDASRAQLAFETSGTTRGTGGKQYLETSALYDAALLAGFQDAMLSAQREPLRYLLFVPNPAQRPHSSLGYMMQRVAVVYGDGREAWYVNASFDRLRMTGDELRMTGDELSVTGDERSVTGDELRMTGDELRMTGDELRMTGDELSVTGDELRMTGYGDAIDVNRFIIDARRAGAERAPVCIAGTAFAFVQLLDALRERGVTSLRFPASSRIMETGGFKGRTRVVKREDLYADLARIFSIPEHCIVAEYGMTELSSQYYDATFTGARIKHAPPWLRPRIVGPDGATLPAGVVGAIVHVDLANRSTCVAIQTEDLGVSTADGGIILLGREQGAQLRGCSLDAEQLRAVAKVST